MQSQNALVLSTDAEFVAMCQYQLKNLAEVTAVSNEKPARPPAGKVDSVITDIKTAQPDMVLRTIRSAKERQAPKLIFTGIPSENFFRYMKIFPKAVFLEPKDYDSLKTHHLPKPRKLMEENAEQSLLGRNKEFRRRIAMACKSSVPVLLTGETGSGKGWWARYIHDHSDRKHGPFVNKPLSEISRNTFESSLFGTTGWAYTGARSSEGFLARAKSGSLFLDEIGLLEPELQGKILGFMDKGTFSKMGGTREFNVEARLLFATDANLEKLAAEGKFMKPLLYRLKALPIHVPPLREHPEDIPLLARSFAAEFGKKLSAEATELLCKNPWPGNIRQLKASVQLSCRLSDNETLEADDINLN